MGTWIESHPAPFTPVVLDPDQQAIVYTGQDANGNPVELTIELLEVQLYDDRVDLVLRTTSPSDIGFHTDYAVDPNPLWIEEGSRRIQENDSWGVENKSDLGPIILTWVASVPIRVRGNQFIVGYGDGAFVATTGGRNTPLEGGQWIINVP